MITLSSWASSLPRLHHNMNYAALDSRLIQPLIDSTLLPDVKIVGGGVCSTYDERKVPFVVSLSNHPGAVSDKPVAIKRLISSKHSRKFLIIGLLLLLAAVAAACFSDSLTAAPVSSQPATFTPFPAGTVQPVPKADSPTAAPVSPQPANVTPLPTATLTTKPKSTLPSSRPSGAGLADVAFDYVTELVEELGPRESATEEELEAERRRIRRRPRRGRRRRGK